MPKPERATLSTRKPPDPAALDAFLQGQTAPRAPEPPAPPSTGRVVHQRKDGRQIRRTTILMDAELAQRVSAVVSIPTIGIGAGAGCDGQVQVFHDILGLGDFLPRHAARYADLSAEIIGAVGSYADDVRSGSFPGDGQSTHLEPEVLAEAELLYAARFGDLDEGGIA